MDKYEVLIEAAEECNILERNYKDLIITIITSCISEGGEDEQGSNLFKGIDRGTS